MSARRHGNGSSVHDETYRHRESSRTAQAHNAAVAHKQALMDRQGSLAAAETQLNSLQSQLSALAAAVREAESRSAKLEQELVESKHRVDVAQARKEEVRLHMFSVKRVCAPLSAVCTKDGRLAAVLMQMDRS